MIWISLKYVISSIWNIISKNCKMKKVMFDSEQYPDFTYENNGILEERYVILNGNASW